jgi:hypothetical protein
VPSADRRNSCGSKSASCAHHQSKNSRNMIRDEADLIQPAPRRRRPSMRQQYNKGSPSPSMLPNRRFVDYGSIKASSPAESWMCRGK